MNTATKQRRVREPEKQNNTKYIFVTLTIIAVMAFGYTLDRPVNIDSETVIETALSENLDTEFKRIITEDLIDEATNAQRHSRQSPLIVEKNFQFPTKSWVESKLDVLRFIRNYNDCYNSADIEAICRIWRMFNGLNPASKNTTLRNFKSRMGDELKQIIDFQLQCDPSFNFEDACL